MALPLTIRTRVLAFLPKDDVDSRRHFRDIERMYDKMIAAGYLEDADELAASVRNAFDGDDPFAMKV